MRFCALQLEEAREGDVHVCQKVLGHDSCQRMNGSGSTCQIAAFIASVARTCGPLAFDCSNVRTSSSCSSSSMSAASSSETSLFSASSHRDFFIKLSRAFKAIVSSTPVRPDFFCHLTEGGMVWMTMWLERKRLTLRIWGVLMADVRHFLNWIKIQYSAWAISLFIVVNGVLSLIIDNPSELLDAINKHGLVVFLIVSHHFQPLLSNGVGFSSLYPLEIPCVFGSDRIWPRNRP